MIDSINANITHAYYYDATGFSSGEDFAAKVKKAFPDAFLYDVDGEMPHQYLTDMQIVEKFLRGGGQTYKVYRFFLSHLTPDIEKAGLSGWCIMLAYFPESNITALSFHYGIKDTTTDNLIAIRQSGDGRKYNFDGQEYSCMELDGKITAALGIKEKYCEHSYLCEITKLGEYKTIDEIEEKESKRLYGFITGDEGYAFVPAGLVKDRLSNTWSSREFMNIYAFGQSFLFLNLIGTPVHNDYLERQTEYGTKIYGSCNPYFFMGDCPLTVNHGILFSVEFVMMLKALINSVLEYQSDYTKKSFVSYYQRIRTTREFRRKIIMVLEKVEKTEISEIGQLSSMLLESQHIAPIVDQVKYLLELLEGDLSLIYSEHNNLLVTVLTVLGLLLAVWQVLLAL